jgi:ADP-heptose:LPS heptosyltransferase
VRGLPFVDEVVEIDPEKVSLSALYRLSRAGRFDLALVLQPRFKILAALWLARVPHRVGPLSKLYSFLLLSAGIRQRRSRVEMHEADYNLQLMQLLGVEVGSRTVLPRVAISPEARAEARGFWTGRDASRWVAIHPGMGGSALNWPEEHYLQLARQLLEYGHGVVVTGGPAEQTILERFSAEFAARHPAQFACFGGARATSVDRLAAVFERVSVVVAPSTGPLHLASALGKPVVTFFPPIRVQSARRWGPYVADLPGDASGLSPASVLVPEVHCGQDFKCRGEACPFHPCMPTLSVAQAFEMVQNHLARV